MSINNIYDLRWDNTLNQLLYTDTNVSTTDIIDTLKVVENTNLYYTEARVNSNTNVLNGATAFSWGNHASANYLLKSGGSLSGSLSGTTIGMSGNINGASLSISGGTSSQFLKANGTVDTNTYLTSNQTITLSGDISGSGTTSITSTIGAGKVTNSMLAGSIDLTTKVSGVLPSNLGGTGVANNPAYTITLGGAITTSNNVIIGSSNHTVSLNTTGNTSITLPTSGTLSTLAGTETLTNKRVTTRVGIGTNIATQSINTDNVDYYEVTGLTTNIGFALSGTPTNGQKLWISITGTASRTITWTTLSFEASTIALPTTTVGTARLDVGFIWNTATSKWRCVGAC